MKNEFDKKSTQILVFTTFLFVFNSITYFRISNDLTSIVLRSDIFFSGIILLLTIFVLVCTISRLKIYMNELSKTNRNASGWRIYATLLYSTLIIISYIILFIAAN